MDGCSRVEDQGESLYQPNLIIQNKFYESCKCSQTIPIIVLCKKHQCKLDIFFLSPIFITLLHYYSNEEKMTKNLISDINHLTN